MMVKYVNTKKQVWMSWLQLKTTKSVERIKLQILSTAAKRLGKCNTQCLLLTAILLPS